MEKAFQVKHGNRGNVRAERAQDGGLTWVSTYLKGGDILLIKERPRYLNLPSGKA
jgi:hypothetical protein